MASTGAGGAGAGAGAAGASADTGSSMKAVVCTGPGSIDNFQVGEATKPSVGKGQLLCKVRVTGINPVDWKMGMYNFMVPSYPIVLGCDFTGEVIEVGSGVTDYAVGDVVFGYPPLGQGGTFGEYCVIEAAWASKLPSNISMEEAATTCVAFDTAALALFGPGNLELAGSVESPLDTPASILVWGGATTVGLAAIQLATAAGYNVITTASAKNHELLTSLGAKHCIDYHDEDHMDRLRALVTEGNVAVAADFVGAATAKSCATLLQASEEARGRLVVTAALPAEPTANVDATFANLGAAYADETSGAYVRKFQATTLVPGLASGKLRPLPVKTLEGFDGIVEALKLSAGNKVSATKLAVRL